MFGAISGLKFLHDVKIFNTTSGVLSFMELLLVHFSSII